MAEKTKKEPQVKYTPPKDKTIPEELKKEKPTSSAAEAQEDIESTLPDSTRKSSGSKGSLSKAQDDLASGKISSDEAHKEAGITKDADITVEDVKVTGKIEPKKAAEVAGTGTKPKTKPKEKKRFTKITMSDGHTYHSEASDAVCLSCLLPKNKTTTQCFKRELSPIGLRKFNEGLIDFKDGVWVALDVKEE